MSNLTEERITDLCGRGFKRWTKGNLDRLYISAAQLGLTCDYYKTGNISSAWFRDEHISNSQGRRYQAARTFIDVKTGKVHSDIKALEEAAMELAGIESND